MPSRRQRKVRAAAAAVADTRAVEVDIDSPLLTDEAINSMLVAYSNSGRHAMEAAEAACGDADAWITTMIELIMADFEREVAQSGPFPFELDKPRIRAVFEDNWDGQIPEISDHSGNPIVMAAQAQGKAKIDKRVGTGTGVTGPGAQHPGARHTTTMEEMIVEAAKHRSDRAATIEGMVHATNLDFFAIAAANPAETSSAHFCFEDSHRSCSVWSRKFRATRKFLFCTLFVLLLTRRIWHGI
jgi:hypothetical protein